MNSGISVMTNTGAVSGTITVGSIPSNMVYWSAPQDPLLWANTAHYTDTTRPWEIEVNFD